jgi:preprotein translocase subunit YajC
MSRMLVVLIVVLVVLVGGMFFLSGRAHEAQQTRVEKAVSLANLQG